MQGKVWLATRATALVDEIPAAYKGIDQVMADQSDLVPRRTRPVHARWITDATFTAMKVLEDGHNATWPF